MRAHISSSLQKRLKVIGEFDRILERQKVVSLLGLGIDVERGTGNDCMHPPLARNVRAVLASKDGGGDIDLGPYNVAPIDARVVVHDAVDGCSVYRDYLTSKRFRVRVGRRIH